MKSDKIKYFIINTCLMLVSLYVALFVCEIALIAFYPRIPGEDRFYWAAKDSGKEFDNRSRLQVVQELRKKGVKAYPVFHPSIFWRENITAYAIRDVEVAGKKILPFLGIPNVTTVVCNETGKYMIYESDELGFHNPKGLYKPNEVDMMLVGDSFTHGECMSNEHYYMNYILKKFPRAINLGMGGNGPLSELAMIKEFASKFKPKTVVWGFYEGNDLSDLQYEKNTLLKKISKPKIHTKSF